MSRSIKGIAVNTSGYSTKGDGAELELIFMKIIIWRKGLDSETKGTGRIKLYSQGYIDVTVYIN